MKCFQLIIKGNWAHFKKPETNNNPLSHDLITKTALIGLMGAVLGIERNKMRALFPQLSDDLLYNVRLLNPVKKVPVGMTSLKALSNPLKDSRNRKSFEILKDPSFLVTLGLVNKRSEYIFDEFKTSVKNSESVYPPCMGWHNCPAELYLVSEGELSEPYDGEFGTKGFVLAEYTIHSIGLNFRVGFDRLPTYQNDDFWNLPDKYRKVVYPDVDCELTVIGKYREYSCDNGIEKLCLI